MFTQTAEYALRATVALAEAGESLSAVQLAERTQVPSQYLSKVLQSLQKSGLLTSTRGKYGGYSLRYPAAEITVLDVVNAVDPLRRIERCPLNRPEHAHALCPLHRQMDEAIAQVECTLSQSSLEDLVQQSGTLHFEQ